MVIMPVWMRVLIAAGLCFATGAVSMLYVNPRTVSWYDTVQIPAFFAMPLPVVFFVLIVTYALMAIAASLMWIYDPRQWDFRGWVPLFFSHLLLISGWIILFFAYNVVFLSLIVGFGLTIFVIMLTAGAWNRSKIAFWLMVPYFVVVLYFLGMNTAVWLNN